MSILENYDRLKNEIVETAKIYQRTEEIQLVAVSKNHPWDEIAPLYEAGCRDFGENRLQEALPKIEQSPKDCHWHYIGSLQKNKVRKVVSRFVLIHSVDSLELAKKISEVSSDLNYTSKILLQVNTSGELSKQGMCAEECYRCFEDIRSLPGISLEGLMTMAPLVESEKIIRQCFADLRELKERLISTYQPAKSFQHLSMGMSHDFKWAIAEGATLLRVGSYLWK